MTINCVSLGFRYTCKETIQVDEVINWLAPYLNTTRTTNSAEYRLLAFNKNQTAE